MCEFSICKRQAVCKGLCAAHYAQQLRGESLRSLRGTPEHWESKLNDNGEKQCTRCEYWLPLSAFFVREDSNVHNQYRSHCRRCNIVRRMSLNARSYDALLASQGGMCKICGISPSVLKKALVIDHDHDCCKSGESCGKCIRGLLCQLCNDGLGRYRDKPELLRAAAAYLEDFK